MNYREVLKSWRWKAYRRVKMIMNVDKKQLPLKLVEYLTDANNPFPRSLLVQCDHCGQRFDSVYINVHHKHYRTLGRERLEDTEVVCWRCHANHHGKEPHTPAEVEMFRHGVKSMRIILAEMEQDAKAQLRKKGKE